MKENKNDKAEEKMRNKGRLWVYVDEDLEQRFRLKVVHNKSSMQEALEDLVRKYVDGVAVSPREVSDDEHDTYVGFVNWLREQSPHKWMITLVEEWTDRGKEIRERG